MKAIHGIINGKTIQLDDVIGLADGAEVDVVIRPSRPNGQPGDGDGFRRTEGALADDTHWDGIMDEVQAARHIERRVPSDEE